ncbi:MAG: alginate lyase family protein [Pseudomonadota bacterium]
MKRSFALAAFASLSATLFLASPALAQDGQSASFQSAVSPPLFAKEMQIAREFVDGAIAEGIVVPQPKDPGGGYTHEQHKKNFRVIYNGGQLYRLTGEEKYRAYVRDMLLAYAKMYPSLEPHPARKGTQSAGRIFWQVLNDAMWLVDSIRGYEAIRATLTDAERDTIDNQLFRKHAEFLSTGSAVTFSKIHNHATWATAGVGMTGYVIGEPEFVEIALKGLDKSGETGFLRQSELLFSPDGYYTEGPYYQRFALKPFVVFAGAIEANEPERKIFEHRDSILLKAIDTTIQLTYGGRFFPFNDAIKDKSLNTTELYEGVAIAYAKTRDPGLLAIADFQGRTVLSQEGLAMTQALAEGKAEPFPFKSMLLTDGPDGKAGAVAVLRDGEEQGLDHTALVAKNASQGFGHGHFDKLSWQLYDNGKEVIRDYGAARFLNIEAKEGGRYLPENTTWAKTSVAHNTLVVDEKSHFDGDVKVADQFAPQQLYFSDADGLQVTSAKIDTAYPGVSINRTMILTDLAGLEAPFIVDLVSGEGEGEHLYDLPLHYSGHIMEYDFASRNNVEDRPVLGTANGYQHIWVDAMGALEDGKGALTWILDGRFYTYRFAANGPATAILGESGANDPNFNLLRDPLLILRAKREGGASFASILEAHGYYDGANERTEQSASRISDLSHTKVDGKDVMRITLKTGERYAIGISHNPDENEVHTVTIEGESVRWTGFAGVVALKGEESQ